MTIQIRFDGIETQIERKPLNDDLKLQTYIVQQITFC